MEQLGAELQSDLPYKWFYDKGQSTIFFQEERKLPVDNQGRDRLKTYAEVVSKGGEAKNNPPTSQE